MKRSRKHIRQSTLAALLALASHVVSSRAANVYVSTFADDYSGSITFVEGGRAVESGTGFVAVGSFASWDETRLATAAGNATELAAALDDFQTHGQATRFGGGFGVAGSFNLDATAAMMPGNPLVGKSIYIVGGTGNGIFIFRTGAVFQADAPISAATVKLLNPGAGSFILGSDGPAVTVNPFSSAQPSVELSGSATGQLLDISRFEALIPVEQPPPPPAPPNAQPPSRSEPPNDPPAGPPPAVVDVDEPPMVDPPMLEPIVFPRWPITDVPGDLPVLRIIGAPGDDVTISLPGFSAGDLDVVLLADVWLDHATLNTPFTSTALESRALGVTHIPEPQTGIVVLAAVGWLAHIRRRNAAA